jgi:hypothetical protein
MDQDKRYYALCVTGDDVNPEIAFFEMRRDEEFGRLWAMAVYTAPDGEAQRKHLEDHAGTEIYSVSPKELLDAMHPGKPTSVLLDGHKIAASVFKGMLKKELGLPIRNPRIIDSEKVFGAEDKET